MTLSAGLVVPASLALLAALSAPWQPAAAAEATGSISGTVISATTAEPIAAVLVYASGQIPGAEHFQRGWTDANGNYTLAGLAADSYTVYFSKYRSAFADERYPNAHGGEAAGLVAVDDADVPGVNVTLDPGGTISGTITSGLDGSPVSGASACAIDATGYEYTCQGTASSGVYVVTGLPVGAYRVRFTPPSGSVLLPEYFRNMPDLAGATPVIVSEGQTTDAVDASLDDPNGDTTGPTMSVWWRTPAPEPSGWDRSPVTVYWACRDSGSGPDFQLVSATSFGEGAGLELTASCEDNAGNVSTEAMPDINIDWTPPTISDITQVPTANAAGWVTSDATVTWTCSDTLSGPVKATGSATVTTQGAGQDVALACADVAGNTASSTASVSLDRTAPALTWVHPISDGAHYLYGQVPAAPTCTATDSLSGPDGCRVTGYSAAVGTHVLTATARDIAGNVTAEVRTYTVLPWTIVGFRPPVMTSAWNVERAGSTLPLKFEVFAGTTELTSTGVVRGVTIDPISCSAPLMRVASGKAADPGTVRFDAKGGYFAVDVKLPREPGTCVAVTVRTADGSLLAAPVRLR